VILNDLLRGTRHLSTGNAPSKTIDGIPVPPVGLFFVIAWLFAGVIDRIAKQQILSGNIPSFTSGVILEGVSDLLYIVTGCLVFYVVFWVSKKHNEIYQGESIL
ncbi:MAG TPA: hypothetical protein VD905_03960, partial [Flavobacteriales bacterium]|nr:hypothetical protein [Flavobacteriales bacterium]